MKKQLDTRLKVGVATLALISLIAFSPLRAASIYVEDSRNMQVQVSPSVISNAKLPSDLDLAARQQAIDSEIEDSLQQMRGQLSPASPLLKELKDKVVEMNKDPRFPMRSTLTLGAVETQAVNLPKQVSAFYLIGDDEVSVAWLKAHLIFLQAHHAVGFITQIDSQDRLAELEEALGVALYPVSLTGLEKHLPVKHYPFWYMNGQVGSQ